MIPYLLQKLDFLILGNLEYSLSEDKIYIDNVNYMSTYFSRGVGVGKYRVSFKRSFGTLEIEAETPEEVLKLLQKVPELLEEVDEVLARKELQVSSASLKGLIYRSEEGPLLTVPKDRLSTREAIALLIYAVYPDDITSRELNRLLTISGWFSPGYASRLTELRRAGYVVKTNNAYKITINGMRWIEGEVIPKAKAGEKYG